MATQQLEPTGTRQLAGKYLTFTLLRESYGIDVLKVREIIRLITITAVPQMPPYVRGVINLRGKIIPVMDLRLKFGFAEAASTEQTCIVVVQVKLPDGKNTQMGLVVDGVEDVTNIAAADIEETPDFGAAISTECILGMAKLKGGVKTLLDIDRVVGTDTFKSLHKEIFSHRQTLKIEKLKIELCKTGLSENGSSSQARPCWCCSSSSAVSRSWVLNI